MSDAPLSTRDRLVLSAATLFQQSGYNGTSVADVLKAAGVPKGSLYHHFPNGKADLAQAAAEMASTLMLDIVARAFAKADSFQAGTRRLADKYARLFERHPHWRACPVQTLLLDGPLAAERRAEAYLTLWIGATEKEARRLGHPDPQVAARRLWTTLIGCWTLARAQDDPAPLRQMPDLL